MGKVEYIEPEKLIEKADQIREIANRARDNFDGLHSKMMKIEGPNDIWSGPSSTRLMDKYKDFSKNYDNVYKLFMVVADHLSKVAEEYKNTDYIIENRIDDDNS